MTKRIKRTAGSARRLGLALLGVLGVGVAVWAGFALAAPPPPTLSISSEPANPTNSTSASFTYSDTQASGFTRFMCSLDGGSFAACGTTVAGSSKTYTGLSAGAHTFRVEAAYGSTTTSPSSYTWTIDLSAPTVSSFTLVGGSPTNAASVSWQVVFSEAVTGMTAAGFQAVAPALGGSPAVTGVSGSGTTYTVSASTGSGNGALALKIPSAGTIKDLAGNALAGTPANGPAYTLDRTPPTVSSFTQVGGSPTNASSVSWQVVFSKAVTGVSGGFQVVVGGGLGGSPAVSGVSGSGTTYTVSASTGSGNGTLGLKIPSAGSIKDLAGNALVGTPVNGTPYTLDRTPPTVLSITRVDPSPTNAASVHWAVTLSKPVTGVASSNFSLNTSGITGSTSVTGLSGSGAAYTLTASTGTGTPSGTGTEQLKLTSAGAIKDQAGNGLSGVPANGETYTVDHLAPTVVSINRVDSSPTKTGPLHWTVTFNEPVSNVLVGRFGLVTSGLAGTAPSITGVSPGSGLSATYTLTVSTAGTTGSNSGQIGLNLTSKGSIQDQAGNGLGGSTPIVGQTYLFDTTPPPAPTIFFGPLPHPPGAVPYTSALFVFFAQDAGSGQGDGYGNGISYLCKLDTGSFTPCLGIAFYSGLSQGLHTFQVEAFDAAGNVSTPTSWTWIVDTIQPTVTFTQTPPNPDANTGPTFAFTGNDGSGSGIASYRYKLDSGGWQSGGSPESLNGLSLGSHTLQVEAIDYAGNISAPAGYTWTIQASTAGTPYTIGGTLDAIASPLFPTTAATGTPVNVTFNNPNSSNVLVSGLTVSIDSVTPLPAHTCAASNYAVTQFTGTTPFQIPPGNSSLQSLGFAQTTWPTVLWVENGLNQDGCEGATVNLTYTGTP